MQTPAQGEANVKAWLALGYYKSWHCETAPSPTTVAASPHGKRRVCTNNALATATAKPWPVGAAAVKELYADDAGGIIGYAVYLKTADDTTAGGAVWYWYEDDPAFNPMGGVVADGLGTAGTPAAMICVNCHSASGSDTTTHAGPGDLVYVRVTM
jgi:hypothetical protein